MIKPFYFGKSAMLYDVYQISNKRVYHNIEAPTPLDALDDVLLRALGRVPRSAIRFIEKTKNVNEASFYVKNVESQRNVVNYYKVYQRDRKIVERNFNQIL